MTIPPPPGPLPWPRDEDGRPWPADHLGRPWPTDPYGRPVSPYLPPPPQPGQVPGLGTPPDLRLYPAAPFTLAPALQAAKTGLRKPIRGITRRDGGFDLLWTLLILFGWLFLSIIGSIIAIELGDSSSGKSAGLLMATVLPWIAMAGGPIVVARLAGNGPIIDFGYRWRWRFLWSGLLYGVLTIVVAFGMAIVTKMIFGDFDSAAGEVAKEASGNTVAFTFILLAIAFGAPIVEELFFRGFVFGAFAKLRLHPILSVLFTALLFGLIHFEPKRLLLLVGIGIVLGVARWRTGSTITSTIAHMVNNLLGVVGLLFTGSIFFF